MLVMERKVREWIVATVDDTTSMVVSVMGVVDTVATLHIRVGSDAGMVFAGRGNSATGMKDGAELHFDVCGKMVTVAITRVNEGEVRVGIIVPKEWLILRGELQKKEVENGDSEVVGAVRRAGATGQHSRNLSRMADGRKCTITLKICPVPVDLQDYDPSEPIKSATFEVSVSGAVLPKTSRSYKCSVHAGGEFFYNVESPQDPLQLTLRDCDNAAEIFAEETI